MALEAGRRVGPYEILGPVGAGGMGEVYRARDPRLAREVAVKILRDRFNDDPGRRRRFESEARAVAALGHPNVLAVHDVGLDADIPYLVTELLDGETLRERLQRGPLTRRAAVDIGRQIAAGLAAAHDQGIVHRDVKPANVFLLRDGQVKILDFGIATSQRASRPDATMTAETSAVTAGTVAYMAPEQVRGQPADARSDIFAFGIVLHEMVGGQRPFRGNTDLEIGAAILDREPPELEDPVLDVLARRCLAKDPGTRFQSAGDLAAALDALAVAGRPAAPRRAARVRWPWIAAAICALALAGGAGLVIGRVGGRPAASVLPAQPSEVHWSQITFRRGRMTRARFAPDGRSVFYGASLDEAPRALYSVALGRPESRELAGGGISLAASARGGELAVLTGAAAAASYSRSDLSGSWYADSGTLAIMPAGGGAPREIATNVFAADWMTDGSLAAARWSRTAADLETVVEAPVGKPIFKAEPARIVSSLRVSPAGDAIALIVNAGNLDDAGMVVVIGLDGRVRARSPSWLTIQGLAWVGGEVWYTAANGDRRALRSFRPSSGEDRLVLEVPTNLTLEDVRDGHALLSATHIRSEVRVAVADGPERDLGWFDTTLLADLSVDGKHLLEADWGASVRGHPTIFLRKTDGSPAVRLGVGMPRSLSPDGRWVVVAHDKADTFQLLPTGPGQARTLPSAPCHEGGFLAPAQAWFPDSARLVSGCADSGLSTWVHDIAGGAPKELVKGFVPAPKAVSPDGKRILLFDQEEAIHLADLAGGPPRRIDEADVGTEVIGWSRDGAGVLLYRRDRQRDVIEIFRLDLATRKRTRLRVIGPESAIAKVKVDMSADERVLAYYYFQHSQTLYLVDGLAPAR